MKYNQEALKNNIRTILKNVASKFNDKSTIDKGKFMKILLGEDYDETQEKN